MKAHTPLTQLADMILAPENLRYACDPFANDSFMRAKATTRDIDGKRLIDHVASHRDVASHVNACRESLQGLLAGEDCNVDPVLMVPVARAGRAPRLIGIPTYRTRCIANALVQVLARETKPRLPPGVRAYIPGVRDPDLDMVKDLGAAIARGLVRYCLVLDFENFYLSLPREKCQSSMLYYGIPRHVAGAVMKLVTVRQFTRGARGDLVEVATDRGSPPGLPHSGLLANLVPHELDEHFDAISNRIFYARYGDDTVSGSWIREEIVGAGRVIRRWATRHELRIKHLSVSEAIR